VSVLVAGVVLVGVGVNVVTVAVLVLVIVVAFLIAGQRPVGVGSLALVVSVTCDAGRAEADDREVRESSFVAEQFLDLSANGIELLGAEGAYGTAALAGEEFSLAATDEHVEAGSVTEVNVSCESVLLERLKVAVHRGDVNSQAVGEVFG
jgi:hypothetical protein